MTLLLDLPFRPILLFGLLRKPFGRYDPNPQGPGGGVYEGSIKSGTHTGGLHEWSAGLRHRVIKSLRET